MATERPDQNDAHNDLFDAPDSAQAKGQKPQDEAVLTSPIDAEGDADVTLSNLHMGGAAQEYANYDGAADQAGGVEPNADDGNDLASAVSSPAPSTSISDIDDDDGAAFDVSSNDSSAVQVNSGGNGSFNAAAPAFLNVNSSDLDVSTSAAQGESTSQPVLQAQGDELLFPVPLDQEPDSEPQPEPEPTPINPEPTPINTAPIASDASLLASEDGPAITGRLDASDVDGDALTYSLVAGPAEGSVAVNADGTYSFDPGEGFQDLGVGESREVSFSYEVSDGAGGTSQATVSVTVTGTNDGPILVVHQDGGDVVSSRLRNLSLNDDRSMGQLDDNTSVQGIGADGTASDLVISNNGVGVRGLRLNTQIDYDPTTGQSEQVVLNFDKPVTNVVLTTERQIENEFPDGETGKWTAYDAEGNIIASGDMNLDTGTRHSRHSFSYEVDTGGIPIAKIVIEATDTTGRPSGDNSDFTLSGVQYQIAEGVFEVGDELTSHIFENAEAGTLIADLDASDVDGDSLTYAIVGGNEDGAFTIDPESGEIRVAEGAVLDYEDASERVLVVEVNDGQGGTDQAEIRINIQDINEAPVAVSDFFTVGEDDTALHGALMATDPDGDALSYTVVEEPDQGTLIFNQDGTYSFDLGGDFQDLGVGESREVSFTYEVSDGRGGTSQGQVNITVQGSNDGPVASRALVVAAEDGGAISGQLEAQDIDGDALTFTLIEGPAEGSAVVNQDGSYSFNSGDGFQDLGVGESREVNFTYEVSDGQGGTSQATVYVIVTGTNDGPSAIIGHLNAVEENSAGATIGEISVADLDINDTHSLSVSDDRFEVIDNVLKLKDGVSLDYEEASNLSVTVTADDGHGGVLSHDFNITITDVDDTPADDDTYNDDEIYYEIDPDDYDQVKHGADGDDHINGRGNSDDLIYGGGGDDHLIGGAGDDALLGEDGDDRLNGASGDDILIGGAGDDELQGASGDDILVGGADDDELNAGSGDDILIGGTGDDELYGGEGSDLFVFGAGDGVNTVVGGNGGGWVDTIQLSGHGADGQEGSWTVTLDNGESYTVQAGDELDLGADVSGTIELDDGTVINFEGVERITW